MVATVQSRYEIESSRYVCRRCEAEVPCEAPYYSAISAADEAFRRDDYCVDCWRAEEATRLAVQGDDAVYAYWRTRRPPRPSEEPRRMRFDTDLVFTFFTRLAAERPGGSAPATPAQSDAEAPAGDDDAPPATGISPAETAPAAPIAVSEREQLAFFFALLLIRKKILELSSTVEHDGREWLKVNVKKERERGYWVVNPHLGADEMEHVRNRICELLQMQM